jgi:tRNA(Ile)-lysidine synthase
MAVLRDADEDVPQVALARPLLGISGGRLKATLRAADRRWIEDPSNDAERFERVRVRKARGLLAGLGLTNDKMALSARRLARAREALDAAVDALQRDARLDVHAGAYASFDAGAWRAAPEELRLRLLGRLIAAFGGQAEPLRLAQLEALVARMSALDFEGATLAGAQISRHGDDIHLLREAGREPLGTLILAPGEAAVWDHRFRVAAAVESPGPIEVSALGAGAFAQLRQQLNVEPGVPANAAATLPAFWRQGELLFVPMFANLPPMQALWDGERRLYSAEFIG